MRWKIGAAATLHGTGILEVLVVVGIAAAGVLAAAVVALGPWHPAGADYPPVVRYNPPAVVTAPHG
jgi:hypothetical protein